MTHLRSPERRAGVLLLVACLLATVTGCGPDYSDLPLPGKNVRGDTYRVTAVFDEALNLAEGAPVKLNGVPVGRVQEVTAQDFKAEVVMDVKESTELREGSRARLRYDTPLGELFVQLTPSRDGRVIEDGGALRERDVSTAPTVEDTLASASLLINGGGLEQLQTITEELNRALGGREPLVRETMDRLNRFLGQANDSTGDIDRLLRALARTSKVLAGREATIDRSLREITPVARVLRRNTDELVDLLVAVDRLSVTAGRVVGATKQQLLSILRQVGPIVDQVLSLKSRFVPGLRSLVRAADFLSRTVEGDFLPLSATVVLDETQVQPVPTTGPSGGPGLPPLPSPSAPLPSLPVDPGLPLPDLGGLGRSADRSDPLSFSRLVEGGRR